MEVELLLAPDELSLVNRRVTKLWQRLSMQTEMAEQFALPAGSTDLLQVAVDLMTKVRAALSDGTPLSLTREELGFTRDWCTAAVQELNLLISPAHQSAGTIAQHQLALDVVTKAEDAVRRLDAPGPPPGG